MRRDSSRAWGLIAGAMWLVAGGGMAAAADSPAARLVAARCLDCHDAATQEGGLSLAGLDAAVTAENFALWRKVLHELDTGRMPPPDGEPPTADERRAAVLDLENRLAAHARAHDARHPTVFRRLNRDEYRHTIHDLLALDAPGFDPADGFPVEVRTHGFATNGESLVTSGFLTRKHVEAAEAAIDRAVHFEPRPEVQTRTLRPPFHNAPTIFYLFDEARWYSHVAKEPQPWQTLHERDHNVPLDEVRTGMSQPGRYRIRIHAEAKFRTADMGLPARFQLFSKGEWDDGNPLRLQLMSGSLRGLDLSKPENQAAAHSIALGKQLGERELGHWDLPDDEPVWLECEAWLDAGEFPRLKFPNGLWHGNYRLNQYFEENRFALLDKDALARYEENIVKAGGMTIPMWFESPRIRVMQVSIEGPLPGDWPPASRPRKRSSAGSWPCSVPPPSSTARKKGHGFPTTSSPHGSPTSSP